MNLKYLSILLLFTFLFKTSLTKSEYKVINNSQTSSSISLILQYFGSDTYFGNAKSPIIKLLNFTLQVYTFDEFSFKITDANNKRFEVPQNGIFPIDPVKNFSFPISASGIIFTYTINPFDFKIIRKSNGAVLFSTQNKKIIYSNYYIQIGTQLESKYLSGLGQRLAQSFFVKDGKWTMFNRDRGEQIDHGVGIQTYGYYPFYLIKQKKGLFHVNYYRTSSALDAIKQTIDGIHYLTFKSIGGIIDFRFFLGDSDPQNTIQKFNFYNGRAYLPPFWSFGSHQSRWGYKNYDQLSRVIYNYKLLQLPLEAIWSDLDYMINSEVFTIDQTNFPLDKMSDLLEDYKWIPIIDPGIKNTGFFYEEGLKRNAFMLDANTKKPFVGKMRVGRTVYPDFFHPNTSQYWKDMLDILYSKVPFSGLWLDSNQFTSFCQGRCQSPDTPAIFDYGNDLPYSPGIDNLEGDMPALNSTHYNDLIQADVHIYNGYIQCYQTFEYLKSKGTKPFILTRSSTLGSSKFAIHWTGDNKASWQFLRSSISDNFNNQLWGSQVIGADLCGFAGNTTDQLCARWYQLGSFYPFVRNHNERSAINQEPYALGTLTARAAISNLKLRYAFLKHIYTLFVSQWGLGTIWKPLFFVFPNDQNCYNQEYLETQFMIGSNILIIPVLGEGDPQRLGYFPGGNWNDFHRGYYFQQGENTVQNSPEQLVPLFIRQGAAIFTQNTLSITKTRDLGINFVLYCSMKFDQKRSNSTTEVRTASGFIMSIQDYNDDSLIENCQRNGCYYNLNATIYLGLTNSLDIDVTYKGGANLNQLISIKNFVIYYGEDRIFHQYTLNISGPLHTTIQLPSTSHLVTQ